MQKRVAILGAGYIADYHRAAIELTPDARLVAVCDLSKPRAEQFAASAGIEGVYTNLGELLAGQQLDCVHVLTPPAGHFDPARQILEAGVSAYIEKPLCASSRECEQLVELAKSKGLLLGVSHNFLCARPYESLIADLSQGRLGRLDQIDIVWQKSLPQIKFGPFGSWLLSDPRHILFDVAPHSFVHALHLAGDLEELQVNVSDELDLPGGGTFYRRWEIMGHAGRTHVRMLLSFIDAFTQHYVSVRGTNGSAVVDFEHNTYVRNEHSHAQMDLDNHKNSLFVGSRLLYQSTRTMANFVLAKAGFKLAAGPFADSIFRAVRTYYSGFEDRLDERIVGELGAASVRLAERVASHVPAPATAPQSEDRSSTRALSTKATEATILVTGGTGFIGRALVKRLRIKDHGVRVLTRSPRTHQAFFDDIGAEVVQGDMLDLPSVEAALDGIRTVYHLARGTGRTWLDYEKSDFEPTQHLAAACHTRSIQLIYTSSIAVHTPCDSSRPIEDHTPPHPGRARSCVYARAKAESEWFLMNMYRRQGLDVVIVRPGIVIGDGCTPLHDGIGKFPYSSSLCNISGEGTSVLPIVLLDDCVEAMALVVERQSEGVDLSGQSFNIVGEEYLTAQQYLDELESCSGVTVKRITTPAWRTWLLDAFKFFVKKVGRNPDAALPSYASIRGKGYLAPYDIRGIKAKLGWMPCTDRQKVIREGIQLPAKQFLD